MKKLQLMLLLMVAMLFSVGITSCSDDKGGDDNPQTDLKVPVNTYDDNLPNLHSTVWQCVTFGSYPQAEVVASKSGFKAVIGESLKDDDLIEDASLYAKLQSSSWKDNETEIEGTRYRRMRGSDALTCVTSGVGHYLFDDVNSWHYFQFQPMKWKVLNVSGNQAFLMADRALDCHEFNSNNSSSTWATCSLRSWMNSDLYDDLFTDSEKAAILQSTVENTENPYFGTTSGATTNDRLYILSADEAALAEEARTYGFYDSDGIGDPARRVKPTMYAMCRGAWISPTPNYTGNAYWYLRTNGIDESHFCYICEFGFVYCRGSLKTMNDGGVVPVMNVDLTKANLKLAKDVCSDDIEQDDPWRSAEDLAPISYDSYGDLHCPINDVSEDYEYGHETSWSKIQYGSYPQTEVTDSKTISALKSATWEGDVAELDGVSYTRYDSRYFRNEPITWRILNISGTKATLLADQVLDCHPYNDTFNEVTWSSCTLRKWMNSDMLQAMFDAQQQKALCEATNVNTSNWYFYTDCGATTTDRVYLLNEQETFANQRAIDYGFLDDDGIADPARRFTATDFAKAHGLWVSEDEETAGNVVWFMRSNGYRNNYVVYVDEYGFMYNKGIDVTCSCFGILPVITVDLAAAGF